MPGRHTLFAPRPGLRALRLLPLRPRAQVVMHVLSVIRQAGGFHFPLGLERVLDEQAPLLRELDFFRDGFQHEAMHGLSGVLDQGRDALLERRRQFYRGR